MAVLTERERVAYSVLPDPNDLPFGITLEDIDNFTLAQSQRVIHNAPVRDVEKQDFWDFVNEPIPEEDSVFTPEVLDVFRKGLIG